HPPRDVLFHSRTPGRPHHTAVLILHGTGGSGSQFLSPQFAGELYGAGQPLDTATHYVILPDNIGHGRSSKPSDGLRARFPHYAYEDMVAAQYRLVTEGLHVNHLLLVMGTSMGCMHSWLWGERHLALDRRPSRRNRRQRPALPGRGLARLRPQPRARSHHRSGTDHQLGG